MSHYVAEFEFLTGHSSGALLAGSNVFVMSLTSVSVKDIEEGKKGGGEREKLKEIVKGGERACACARGEEGQRESQRKRKRERGAKEEGRRGRRGRVGQIKIDRR